ncbi:MAG: PLxRFG domain-containing protein [Ignavibacteria bacterium]|nr:PLxRFG domain-containing protein [Ignavibacteria bacterium]
MNTAGDFTNTAGLIAETFGSDEYAQGFYEKAEEFSTRAAQYKPTIGRIENIQSAGDLAAYLVETLVEQAPMLASMLVPGGIVAKGAQLAGASLKSASVAGTTAAFLSNVGLQTGESTSIARDAGKTPVDVRVIGSGLGKAALDFVPLIALAKRLGLAKNLPLGTVVERTIVGKLAEGGFIRRAAGHAGAIVAREVPTEVAQEVLNIALQRALQDYGGDLTPDEISQLKNAAAGATAFGLLGIPAAIRVPASDVPSQTDNKTPEGVDIQIDETEGVLDVNLATTGTVDPTEFSLVGAVEIVADEPSAVLGDFFEPIPVRDPELPALEDVADTPTQRIAAQAALVEEAALTDTAYYIDMNGDMISSIPSDPLLKSEGGTDPISVGLELTRQQLEIASSYPQYLDSDPSSPEGQSIAALHPGLQKLFELRGDLFEDADNYRSTDGQLKKAVQSRIDVLDIRIGKLQEALGIQPVDTKAKVATPENVQEGEVVVETPPTDLTESQKARLEVLGLKEEQEGLSPEEYETYAELIGIASGEFGPVERQKQTQAELTETAELSTKVRNEETVSKERLSTRTGTKGKPGTGIAAQDGKVMVEKFAKFFRFGPKVRLMKHNHPEVMARRKRYGKEIRGWWDPKTAGTVNVVTDNHFTEKDLLATYFHETIAHYGMGTFLTQQEQTDVLRDILHNPPPGFDVQAIQQAALDRGETAALWIEAEEYIARVAETAILDPKSGIVQMSWFKRLIARIRRFLRRSTKFNWSDNDILYMLRDTSKLLTGQITPRNPVDGTRIFDRDNEMMRLFGDDVANLAGESINSLKSVWGAQWASMLFTPLQFNSKYQVPGGNEFLEFVQQWWARKRVLTDEAAQLTQEFLNYGPRDQIKLSEVILKISIRSDEVRRKLTPAEQVEVFTEVGIQNDTALIKIWEKMDKSFQNVIVELRKGLETIAIRTQGNQKGKTKLTLENARTLQKRYAQSQAGTAADRKAMWQVLGAPTMLRLNEIGTEMNQLENRNYFPRMRFGNWAITVRAKKDLMFEGKSFRGPRGDTRGDVVFFQTYEDTAAQAAAWKALKKDFPETSYQGQLGKITDDEFHFMGSMSPQLYEKIVDDIPDMTESQKEALRELYLKQSPGRSFLRHLTQRKGIEGYSKDVLRVYSSYMMNVANHIARVEYHIDMNDQLKIIDENAARLTPDARIAGIISEYFNKQYDYIMNPKNDLAHLRAMGFLWYLGANVKSAVVNLTQVPMVAYPYLASKYGDARSSGAILNAMQLVTRSKVNGEVMPPELRKQLAQAVREGFVDESRATELAGLAEQGALQRLIPERKTGRAIANASYYGAWLFQKAERWNREVTFIAAYNLARQNGVTSQEEAFRAGRDAVQTAMFEYSKWNRAPFMRGKKSVFFLFWQYMQGMAFMAFGGAGQGAAMRLWMTLLLAGGLQGLPFAENILDLLDFVGTQTKQRLGMKDPRVDLRNDLRELANEITDRPDLIMHGLSRYYGLGPLHLLNMFEIPVPNVDISGSISAGRFLPGTEDITSPERDPSAKLGRTIADIAGPVAGIPYQIFRAALDQNPDTWKVWERTLPTMMKNISTAARRGYRGEERFRGGGVLAQFDVHDLEGRLENIAQYLGFASTRVNQRYESDFAIENMKRYWSLRRALVMENVAYARMAGDPEVIKDTMDALRKFNDVTPDPALRINVTQLLRSLKQRFRRASLRERGIPSELLFRRISLAMRELYPETEVEIESLSRR